MLWRKLFLKQQKYKKYYKLLTTVSFFVKTSLMRNYFPKRTSGALLHTLSKLYDVPVGFVSPPLLRQCIATFAVAEGWLLLDIGWFVFLEYGGLSMLLIEKIKSYYFPVILLKLQIISNINMKITFFKWFVPNYNITRVYRSQFDEAFYISHKTVQIVRKSIYEMTNFNQILTNEPNQLSQLNILHVLIYDAFMIFWFKTRYQYMS